MSDKRKSKIIKVLIVISASLLISYIPLGIVYNIIGLSVQTIGVIARTHTLIALVFCGLVTVALPWFGVLAPKRSSAEKIPCPFHTYNELLKHLQTTLSECAFNQLKTHSTPLNAEIHMYIKPSGLWEMDCVSVIYVPELSDELLEDINDGIGDILKNYYQTENITDTIKMITIFCVERITPSFRKVVNSQATQGLKNGRLPVGISFGGRTIYISRQTGNFGIGRYRRMRRLFQSVILENRTEDGSR